MTKKLAAIAAALLALTTLAIFWPGIVVYDSVGQYAQAVTNDVGDWHPPVMVRLWQLLGAGRWGQQPLFLLQTALIWTGTALLASGINHPRHASEGWHPSLSPQRPPPGKGWRPLAILLIPALPLFLGWEAVVAKDVQLLAALTAATGTIGHYRLRNRRVPPAAQAATALFLTYATLVRANGAFATAPLLAAWLVPQRPLRSLAIAAALLAAMLAIRGPIDHRLLGAKPEGAAMSLATYDLAGIAHYAGPGAPQAATPARWQAVAKRGCYTPFFWDRLGEPTRCGGLFQDLSQDPPALWHGWLATIAHHPLAYAEHRLAHANSTFRWIVPHGWPLAEPPATSEPNDYALASPGKAAAAIDAVAAVQAETPLGWPIVWLTLALALTWPALTATDPATRLAGALFASAGGYELGYLLVSPASDLRYHLWPMLATALGLALAGALPRRALARAAIAALIASAVGLAARATLPLPPRTYAAMLASDR